ncbi:MAG: cysteine synthase A [Erysipelothrix sp.]|nr:cysteine synthase A [Erysipelothrix sp.]
MLIENITEAIGNTPLLRLSKMDEGLPGNIYAKLEGLNPGGSVKDRIALSMITDAIASGVIKSSTTIIEATSGNTGIGIAMIGASLGFKVIIVMPDTMSVERRAIIKGYGAEIILTPGVDGMNGSLAKAAIIKETLGDAIILSQFTNVANIKAHYTTTGPEIYKDLNGAVDILVSGVGTGGTLTGTGNYLREKNKNLEIVAVEPLDSSVLSGNEKGPHKIQGIGAGFIPDILDTELYNEIIMVSNDDALNTARDIAKKSGYLAGISSGAALHAAIEIASREENRDKNIVVVLPDSGERYLSTDLFALYA